VKDQYKAVGSWGTLGLEIVLSVMIGFFGGRWLDAHAGTAPWLSLLGFLFGCGAAGKSIHRTWQEMAAVTAREEREQGNPMPRFDSARDREEAEKDAEKGGSPASVDAPKTPAVEEAEEDDEHPR